MHSRRSSSRAKVLSVLREHRPEIERFGVKSLVVFGSVVAGRSTQANDVDVVVEFSRPVGLLEFIDLKDYLEGILGRAVDLVPRDALKRQLRRRILEEAVDVLKEVAFRNVLAHRYFDVSLPTIWQALREDLPSLRRS